MTIKTEIPDFFRFKGKKIGENQRVFIIAELGINHSGSLKQAMKLVDSAHKAGAEIVKHQTHVIEDEMSSVAKDVIPGNADESIYDILSDFMETKTFYAIEYEPIMTSDGLYHNNLTCAHVFIGSEVQG